MKILRNIFILLSLMFCIKGNIKIIGFGSSSLAYMEDPIREKFKNITYINMAKNGEIIETMAALQGANQTYINFYKVRRLSPLQKYDVDIFQKYNYGNQIGKRVSNVKIDEGLYGILDFRNKIFEYNGSSEKIIKKQEFNIDFGLSKIAINSINIICVGKNNIVVNKYKAEQVLNYIDLMTEFLIKNGNNKFIVCGNFIDRGSDSSTKKEILNLNQRLKDKYQKRYFDMQDYLTSDKIWNDLAIDPTEKDLSIQKKGELPLSLSRDERHLNEKAYKQMVKRLHMQFIDLDYL